MKLNTYSKTVIIFMGFCGTWIIISDFFLGEIAPDIAILTEVSIAKDICFFLVMSFLLFFLLRRLHETEVKAYGVDINKQLFTDQIADFFSSVPIVFYTVEIRHHRIVPIWVSENVTRIFGCAVKDPLSQKWWEQRIHPKDRLRVIENAKEFIHVGGGDQVYRIRHKDGSYRYIHDELRAVNSASGFPRFIGIWQDVSDVTKAQESIEEYSNRLEKTVLGTVSSIAKMVELRDPYTSGHEERVGNLAARIAEEMGLVSDTQYGLKIAGLVHDIGKISIPSEYLTKPTRLSKDEFNIIKTHAENGYEILKNIDFPWPIATVAYQHHERIDGSGYPNGLKGDEIILEAKILAVADVIESMATSRPYRHALGLEQALSEVERNAGITFDADVVMHTLKIFKEKSYQLSEMI